MLRNSLLSRYPTTRIMTSNLDPMEDALGLVQYLASRDYLANLLLKRHRVSQREVEARVKIIIPHITAALEFIKMTLDGPTDISFVPAYYAILDLLKVYVLLGPRHQQLLAQRHHGATYKVNSKDSQSLFTEEITLLRSGALPLFYETVTGGPPNKQRVRMSDVYPFIMSIGAEYVLAAGEKVASPGLAQMLVEVRPPKHRASIVAQVQHYDPDISLTAKNLKVLHGFHKHDKGEFRLREAVSMSLSEPELYAEIQKHLRPYLIYRQNEEDYFYTPVCGKSLLLPEELPIALAFFHMSNVARYKPEFLARLRDSRYWPLLSAARRHAIFRMAILFWSYLHQETLLLVHR